MINTVIIDDKRRNRFNDFYWQIFASGTFQEQSKFFMRMIEMAIENEMRVVVIFLQSQQFKWMENRVSFSELTSREWLRLGLAMKFRTKQKLNVYIWSRKRAFMTCKTHIRAPKLPSVCTYIQCKQINLNFFPSVFFFKK